MVVNNFTEYKDYPRSEWIIPKNYQHLWAFDVAIGEINRNNQLLPNTSLKYIQADNQFSEISTIRHTLELLTNSQGNPTSYNCNSQKGLMAVIGALSSQNSIQMANLLTNYKIPQLSHGSFDPVLSNKIKFPFFYRMAPNEKLQYTGIVQLLKHFGWTWVGLFTSDDSSGDTFLQFLRPRLRQNNICLAFVQKMPVLVSRSPNKFAIEIYYYLWLNEVNLILVHGGILSMDLLQHLLFPYEFVTNLPMKRVWIITCKWDFTTVISWGRFPAQTLNGTLSFELHTNVVPGFEEAIDSIHPAKNFSIQDVWQFGFKCYFSKPNRLYPNLPKCTGQEKLRSLPGTVFETRMSGRSYSIYNAVYTVAHALLALHSRISQWTARGHRGIRKRVNIQPWQLNRYLQKVRFNNSAGDEIFFDEKGELASGFDIINTIAFHNQSFWRNRVGRINPRAPVGQEFSINASAIVWNPIFNQVVPFSKCVKNCQPGSSKIVIEGKDICCYSCSPCPERMISVQIDAEQCQKCPEDQFPNEKRNQCIPRSLSFLSYGEPLGAALVSLALFFSFLTILVMGLFLLHWDTPIVKANNRSITCTLLTSLLLGVLSSFLFIGQPGKVTCLLRQTVFGLTFSLSVSCVLAKTITVVLVFMATQPGNSLLKWAGKRLATSIIILGTLIQTTICTVWIATSPPFPELNLDSEISQITVQCNEGSEIMFYVVLGYMGLLAIMSFILAFLARRLPNSFNEAKLITFSLLLFCTVWVSFVPTYLSTKGKFMVAVEIFSILASDAGLLGGIFFPKCYIIVVRPQLNTRHQLSRKENGFS